MTKLNFRMEMQQEGFFESRKRTKTKDLGSWLQYHEKEEREIEAYKSNKNRSMLGPSPVEKLHML